MGYCKLYCPDDETECCICCTKREECDSRCDDMDSYEWRARKRKAYERI